MNQPNSPTAASSAAKSMAGKGGYWPLVVIILTVSLAAAAEGWSHGMWSRLVVMREFMALFWLTLSMLKLFDLRGFADLFQMYDLIGKHSRVYSLTYPFVELTLGLAYKANVFPILTDVLSLLAMVIAALGVLSALHGRMPASWCCLGAFLTVPLSPLAAVVDLGMAAMAGAMLWAGSP
jgi:hypothetical protein